MTRFCVVMLLCIAPGITQAADISVVVGGWSHHFVPAVARDALNQNQDTLGLELSTPVWDLQASHMTDSFGCSSYQVALARRWEIFQAGSWLRGGFMLGAAAAYRCTAPAPDFVGEYSQIVPFSDGTYAAPPGNQLLAQICDPRLNRCELVLFGPFPIDNQRHFVRGLFPGAYLDLGDRVQAQLTLIQSPWAGHHLVLYGQLSVKVFSF